MKSVLPNIFLVGPMAAGKSTIGRQLSHALSWKFYDTDQEIEARAGATIAWIYDVEGEEGLQKREEQLLEAMVRHSHIVLATGEGTIISDRSRTLLAQHGYVIYLAVELEHQVARTRRDRRRPLLYKTDTRRVLMQVNAARTPLYREIAHWEHVTDNRPARFTVQKILTHLQQHFALPIAKEIS